MKIKFTGNEDVFPALKRGEIYDAKVNMVDVKSDTGDTWCLCQNDFEVVDDDTKPEVADKPPSGLRDLIGQDMQEINVKFK